MSPASGSQDGMPGGTQARAGAGVEPLRIFAVVGTDHHPFDRLVRAMDEWTRARMSGTGVSQPRASDGDTSDGYTSDGDTSDGYTSDGEAPDLFGWSRVDSFVQYGTASAPSYATGSAYLDHQELQARMESAAIVVSHGGPSTIVEARQRGLRPVVMPRNSAYGEHVDDHQIRFARRLARSDLVTLVESPEELVATLDRLARDPSSARLADGEVSDNREAVQRFGDLVATLFTSQSGGTRRRIRWPSRRPGRR